MVMMKSFEDFISDFNNVSPNSMNMSIYRDSFQCACGQSHWFDESIDVVCQAPIMKIIVTCPNNPSYITSLKIKTFMMFKFKGFESLAGTHLSKNEDVIAFAAIRNVLRTR